MSGPCYRLVLRFVNTVTFGEPPDFKSPAAESVARLKAILVEAFAKTYQQAPGLDCSLQRFDDVGLAPLPQSDGLLKPRPAILLRRTPPFGDWLICGAMNDCWADYRGFSQSSGTPNLLNLEFERTPNLE